VAAVDDEHAPGHEGAGIRREQQEGAVEVLGTPEPPLGDALDQPPPGVETGSTTS
jgi:hypothetical protein